MTAFYNTIKNQCIMDSDRHTQQEEDIQQYLGEALARAGVSKTLRLNIFEI